MVVWADGRKLAEVSALRKQRVEGLQIGIVRIFVAAGHVRLEAQARAQRRMLKRVAGV